MPSIWRIANSPVPTPPRFNPHVAANFAKLFDKYAVLDAVRKPLRRARLDARRLRPVLVVDGPRMVVIRGIPVER